MAKVSKDDNQENLEAPDPVAFTQALINVYSQAQPVFQKFMSHYSQDLQKQNFDPLNISAAYAEYMRSLMSDPQQVLEMQTEYWQKWGQLWQDSMRQFMGEEAATSIQPEKGDRRFKDPEWQENAMFDFIKKSYLMTADWMESTVRDAENLDNQKREKLAFYARQFANAMSPTNFLMTNPEVLKETIKTGGGNLIRGLENLVEDLERGEGQLKISTTDYEAFELGKNIAITPGTVVYQNELMQLIQYKPKTKKVFKRPLLIIPPWINKYYILDLRPDNSLVAWLVGQGHTVFTVSWVNPTPELAQKRFEDYMHEGILDSLKQISKITGEKDCNVVGYCLGGTLLAITMAYLAAKKQSSKIASATFLTTLLDFEQSGEMKLFLDDEQLELMDRKMAETGVLQARHLQQTFSMLRSNDLIWSFVINNYLMGKEPFPFDLLYWNDDSTNMPAAMHSFYLRKMYRDNLLRKPGGITMEKTPIDLSKVKTPSYFLSTREDHIAPWHATYVGTKLLGGPKTFTLAASGHIAGVVNAPEKKKYCYWSADKTPKDPDKWLETAKENQGSWWPHWAKWLKEYGGTKVTARKPSKGIEIAPGSYVKMKSD